MDKQQYYQQMLQYLDIHTEEGGGGETEAQGHRLDILLQKETQNGPQTEVNGVYKTPRRQDRRIAR